MRSPKEHALWHHASSASVPECHCEPRVRRQKLSHNRCPMNKLLAIIGAFARRIRGRKSEIPAWIEEERQKRETTKVRYTGIFDEATALFLRVDPARINFEINAEEYEPEVGTVLPRLEGAASVDDVRRILKQELDRWFGRSYEPSRLDQLASELWPPWVAWRFTAAP